MLGRADTLSCRAVDVEFIVTLYCRESEFHTTVPGSTPAVTTVICTE